MNNIFRVPVDNQHFKDTIETGKTLQEVSKFLNGEDLALVKRISNEGNVRYWGSLSGDSNLRNFEKLKEGDELLCYRSGKYIALAKIAFKTKNVNLAKYSWGETELKTTWELIYFFSEVTFFQIDSGIVNKEFGFKDGPVIGFNAISEDKAREFNQKYGSMRNFLGNLGVENLVQSIVSEEFAKIKINSPFEAQYYLVDLGNQLEYETYVPPTDAGHEVFGKRLGELITIHKEELSHYVAPAILSPLSNIDVIWFKTNYSPKFFYEVIQQTGMNEAFARLKAVANYYESAKTRIIGNQERHSDFERSQHLYFPEPNQISYKYYEDLIHVHSETLHYKKLVYEFLN